MGWGMEGRWRLTDWTEFTSEAEEQHQFDAFEVLSPDHRAT